jgi:hypothetical protein
MKKAYTTKYKVIQAIHKKDNINPRYLTPQELYNRIDVLPINDSAKIYLYADIIETIMIESKGKEKEK